MQETCSLCFQLTSSILLTDTRDLRCSPIAIKHILHRPSARHHDSIILRFGTPACLLEPIVRDIYLDRHICIGTNTVIIWTLRVDLKAEGTLFLVLLLLD
jgi:hypothetical protein